MKAGAGTQRAAGHPPSELSSPSPASAAGAPAAPPLGPPGSAAATDFGLARRGAAHCLACARLGSCGGAGGGGVAEE